MKKTFRTLSAIVLSAALLGSAAVMPMTAFADDTYNITMTSTTGHTYKAYQVFTGDLTGGKLINIDWGTGVNSAAVITALKAYSTALDTAIGEATGTEAAAIVANFIGANYNQNDANMKAIAAIIGKNTTATKTDLTGLHAGYYLIKDETTTLPTDSDGKTSDTYSEFILKVTDNVSIAAKDSTVESHKTVAETDDTTPTVTAGQKVADYDIGDTVPYELTFKLPSNYAEYENYPVTFSDDMCKGLSWDGTAKIYYGATDTTGADITFSSAASTKYTGGQKWTFKTADLKTITGLAAGDVITVKYNAILDSEAEINENGNENTYHVTFYSDPNVSTTPGSGDTETPPPPTDDTPDDTTVVFTYELVFNKVDDQATPQALPGADFKLEKNVGGTWTEVTALHTGTGAINPTKSAVDANTTTFTFSGLDAGSYKLTEIQTPTGFNPITPIEFTVVSTKNGTGTTVTGLSGTGLTLTETFDASDAKLTATIQNKSGIILPGTGGIGTTIFYVVGVLFIAGGAVLLISKKRMNIKEK